MHRSKIADPGFWPWLMHNAKMAELGKPDGNIVDSSTMALLNSGINLSHADDQELTNRHKDNAVMTRIFRERDNANRPQEKGTGSTIIRTIYHACESGTIREWEIKYCDRLL